jgi:heme/copper-type cytochrome/quinol oxidase subunit 2
MLTKRTVLLTASGLLTGYLAAAQTPAAAPATSGSSILFWVMLGVLGMVLVLTLVTGASVASAVHHFPAAKDTAAQDQNPSTQKGASIC